VFSDKAGSESAFRKQKEVLNAKALPTPAVDGVQAQNGVKLFAMTLTIELEAANINGESRPAEKNTIASIDFAFKR